MQEPYEKLPEWATKIIDKRIGRLQSKQSFMSESDINEAIEVLKEEAGYSKSGAQEWMVDYVFSDTPTRYHNLESIKQYAGRLANGIF